MAQNIGQAGFIDVETTGLDYLDEEIIELALVVFRFDKDTGEIIDYIGEYSGLREPEVPIKKRASEVHGLYRRHVKGKSLDHDRLIWLLERCEFLIAHNADFDRDFINKYFSVNGIKRDPPFSWYCSMKGIDWSRRRLKRVNLQNLLYRHGIKIAQTHRALDDCKAAIQLLQAKNKDGEYYLKELISGPPLFDGTKYVPPPHQTLEEILQSHRTEEVAAAKSNTSEKDDHRNRAIRTIALILWAFVLLLIISQCAIN